MAAARVALGPGPDGQVLVTHLHSGIDMTRKLIRCLCPAEWLNDEVMNLYMGLLQARRRGLGHPRYCMQSGRDLSASTVAAGRCWWPADMLWSSGRPYLPRPLCGEA